MNTLAERNIRRFIGFCFWGFLAFTTYIMLVPITEEETFGISDLALHAIFFSVLSYGLILAYLPKRLLIAGALMLAYGVLVEGLQWFGGVRTAEWVDVVFDALGILIGSAAAWLLGDWTKATMLDLWRLVSRSQA